MKSAYYLSLSKIKAYRKERDIQKEFIYNNLEYLHELVKIGCSVNDKAHQKALWIIELICEEKIELFLPHIEEFCLALKNYKGDEIFRPASKICMFLSNSKKVKLTENQTQNLIEFCLDRAIDFRKAASLSYATHALLNLAKNNDWIYDELLFIFERDLEKDATRGVIFTVKDTLRKINKIQK